jgi:hypothetical protein
MGLTTTSVLLKYQGTRCSPEDEIAIWWPVLRGYSQKMLSFSRKWRANRYPQTLRWYLGSEGVVASLWGCCAQYHRVSVAARSWSKAAKQDSDLTPIQSLTTRAAIGAETGGKSYR